MSGSDSDDDTATRPVRPARPRAAPTTQPPPRPQARGAAPIQGQPAQGQPATAWQGNRGQGAAATPRVQMGAVAPIVPQQAQPIMRMDAIPDDVSQWTGHMLRVLGWNSKKAEHGKLSADIGAALQAKPARGSPLVQDMRQKHADLGAALALNGVWDSAQEMQAAEIKATLAFESMPGGKAELQTGSANATFWAKGAPDPATGEDREFLFKPASKHSLMSGMPKGGEPVREALAGRAAEQLRAFTGLDFNMPTTNVIAVDSARLADYTGGAIQHGASVPGSLQQFSASDGDLRKNFTAQKGNVSAQSCQNVVLLDTVMLNLDRHDGNLLLGKNGKGLVPIDHGLSFPGKDTIANDMLALNMAGEKNVMLRLPNAYKPFSALSLSGIADIDPDLMTAALKAEAHKVGQVHPSTQGTMANESFDYSNLSTRFLKKAAPTLAPAVLQIALGMHGQELLDPRLGQNPQAWDQRATAIIADYAAKAPAIERYWMLSGDEREAIYAKLKQDGMIGTFGVDNAWIYQNVDLVVEYCQSDAKPPAPPATAAPVPLDAQAAAAEISKALPKVKLDKKKSAQWMADWERIRALGGAEAVQQAMLLPGAPKPTSLSDVLDWVKKADQDHAAKKKANKLDAVRRAFPNMTPLDGSGDESLALEGWDTFMRLGGMRALQAAQQAKPTIPAPLDVRGAVMLMLTPAPNAGRSALKRLSVLDQIVAADPALVSQTNQAAIAQLASDILGQRVPGDPAQAVSQLMDTVIADATARMKARFDALEKRLTEDTWVRLGETWFVNMFGGKVLDVLPELHRQEASAPARPIR